MSKWTAECTSGLVSTLGCEPAERLVGNRLIDRATSQSNTGGKETARLIIGLLFTDGDESLTKEDSNRQNKIGIVKSRHTFQSGDLCLTTPARPSRPEPIKVKLPDPGTVWNVTCLAPTAALSVVPPFEKLL